MQSKNSDLNFWLHLRKYLNDKMCPQIEIGL